MEIDISIDSESLAISVDDPHRFNASDAMGDIIGLGEKAGVDIRQLEIDKLIPRMIRGVAGCENGCPSDAKSLVRSGFGEFNLSYIEGGILTAEHRLENGRILTVKIFPDFD